MHKETPQIFLTLPNSSITIKIAVKQVNKFGGYGLAILLIYFDLGPHKVIEWITRHITKELELTKNSTERCMK